MATYLTWRCGLNLAGNMAFGALAGFGIAEVAGVFTPLFYECIGLLCGGLAGVAACL